MPRLTNEMREQIRASVMASTHRSADVAKLMAETTTLVRSTLLGQLPKDFLAATEAMPSSWFGTCTSARVLAEDNPEVIANHGGQHKNRHKFWVTSADIKVEAFRVPHSMSSYNAFPFDRLTREEQRAGQGWSKVLAKQIKEAKRIWSVYSALDEEVKAFLLSVTTTEALLKAMPEYERHVPKPPAKPMPLAVIPTKLRAQMTAAGFDTGA